MLRPQYEVSLSDNLKSFIIFEQLPRKCRLEIIEEGIGYDSEHVTFPVLFSLSMKAEKEGSYVEMPIIEWIC